MAKQSNIFITFIKSFLLFMIYSSAITFLNYVFSNETLAYLLGGVFSILIINVFYRKKIKNDLKEFGHTFKTNYKKVLLVSTILISLEVIVVQILLHFNITSANQAMGQDMILKDIILMSINSIIVIPICEDFVFRLPYIYSKNSKVLNYILYSVIFALVHMGGISNPLELLYIIPYLLLSFGIGYGFYKTDNIFMSTLVHMINNFLSIMLILI